MPFIKTSNDIKLDDDNETIPLYAYTLSTSTADVITNGNISSSTTPSTQILLQNSLSDDTTYLQDIVDDGTTSWTLDGLSAVLFPSGQPILLNQSPLESLSTNNSNVNLVNKNNDLVNVVTTQGETIDINLLTNDNGEHGSLEQIPVENRTNDDCNNIPYENSVNLITTVLQTDENIQLNNEPFSTVDENSFITVNNQLYMVTKDVNNIDEETDFIEEQNNDNELVDEDVQSDTITLSTEITELADLITAYKCKRCSYTTSDKDVFLEHYRTTHLNQSGTQVQLVVHDPTEKPVENDVEEVEDEEEEEVVEVGDGDNQLNPLKYIIETDQGTFEFDASELNINNIIDEDEDTTTIKTDADVDEKCVLICSQCTKGFDSIEDCKQHMIIDHKLKELGSSKTKSSVDNEINSNTNCNQSDVQQSNISLELFTKKTLKPRRLKKVFKCERVGCILRFSTEQAREEHMKCHLPIQSTTNDGSDVANIHTFKCSVCGLVGKSWRTTALHLYRQHNIQTDVLICPICNVYRATEKQLDSHMDIHSETKSYCCSVCGKCFKQATQLRNHAIIHLDKNSDKRPLWNREKACSQCHKILADSQSLRKHIQSVHSKLKPFICNVCGHSSARKAMLQLHLRQHTGEKPYSCIICNYRTGDHNSLRRHQMKHTGMRPYKCPHCPYTSIQSNAYKYHISIKHPGRSGIYACKSCPFKSVSEEVYYNHIIDHQQGVIQTTTTAAANVIDTETPKTVTSIITTKSIPGSAQLNQIKENFNTSIIQIKDNVGISNTEIATEKNIVHTNCKEIDNIQKSSVTNEDTEEPCYLQYESLTDDQCIDTGGITIPACESEINSTLLQMALLS